MKLKFAILGGVAALLSFSTAAQAQTNNRAVVGLGAVVQNSCYLTGAPVISNGSSDAQVTQGSVAGGSTGAFFSVYWPKVADSATATPDWVDYEGTDFDTDGAAARVRIEMRAVCNFGNANLAMSSAQGGMKNTSAPLSANGNFSNAISYAARATWGGVAEEAKFGPKDPGADPIEFKSDSSLTDGETITAPTNDTMVIDLRLRKAHKLSDGEPVSFAARSDFPLLAGSYDDTLTVTFGARP